jgi:hypothetical protein
VSGRGQDEEDEHTFKFPLLSRDLLPGTGFFVFAGYSRDYPNKRQKKEAMKVREQIKQQPLLADET